MIIQQITRQGTGQFIPSPQWTDIEEKTRSTKRKRDTKGGEQKDNVFIVRKETLSKGRDINKINSVSFSVSLPHCLPSYSHPISCSLIPSHSPLPPGWILAVLAISLSDENVQTEKSPLFKKKNLSLSFSLSYFSLQHHSIPCLTGTISLQLTLCRLNTTKM